MIIGNFTYDSKINAYAGGILTLTTCLECVRIVPNDKNNEKEPDYRVIVEGLSGVIELGAAWKRTSERGQDFLSVSIDDPALSGSLNAALFADEANEDKAVLVWNRPKPKAEVKPAKASSKAKAA